MNRPDWVQRAIQGVRPQAAMQQPKSGQPAWVQQAIASVGNRTASVQPARGWGAIARPAAVPLAQIQNEQRAEPAPVVVVAPIVVPPPPPATVIIWDIVGSAQNHYPPNAWGAKYNVTTDGQLKAMIRDHGSDDEGNQNQDLGVHTVVAGEPRSCNILYNNSWNQHRRTIRVWQNGLSS